MELVNSYLEKYKQYKELEKELKRMEVLFNEIGDKEYEGEIGKVRLVNVKPTEIPAHTRNAYSYYRVYFS